METVNVGIPEETHFTVCQIVAQLRGVGVAPAIGSPASAGPLIASSPLVGNSNFSRGKLPARVRNNLASAVSGKASDSSTSEEGEVLSQDITSIICVVRNNFEIDNFATNLRFLLPSYGITDYDIFAIPEPDVGFFEQNNPSPQIQLNRALGLVGLAKAKCTYRIIVTTPNSFVIKTVDPFRLADYAVSLYRGMKLDSIELRNKVVEMGYWSVDDASDIGQVSLCGEALSIANGIDSGIRLIFNETHLERILPYNLTTKGVFNELNSVSISPHSEVVVNTNTVNLFTENHEKLGLSSPHFSSIVRFLPSAPYWTYAPLFLPHAYPVATSANAGCIIFCDGCFELTTNAIALSTSLFDKVEKIFGLNAVPPKEVCLVSNQEELDGLLLGRPCYSISMVGS